MSDYKPKHKWEEKAKVQVEKLNNNLVFFQVYIDELSIYGSDDCGNIARAENRAWNKYKKYLKCFHENATQFYCPDCKIYSQFKNSDVFCDVKDCCNYFFDYGKLSGVEFKKKEVFFEHKLCIKHYLMLSERGIPDIEQIKPIVPLRQAVERGILSETDSFEKIREFKDIIFSIKNDISVLFLDVLEDLDIRNISKLLEHEKYKLSIIFDRSISLAIIEKRPKDKIKKMIEMKYIEEKEKDKIKKQL